MGFKTTIILRMATKRIACVVKCIIIGNNLFYLISSSGLTLLERAFSKTKADFINYFLCFFIQRYPQI